jgi:protein SCO1/2
MNVMEIRKWGMKKRSGPKAARPPIFHWLLAAALMRMASFSPASAQPSLQPERGDPNVRPDLLKNVGIDQHLDAPIPPDLVFQDEHGKPVKLGQFFDGTRPVILTLNYFQCPMLCTVELNSLLKTLQALTLKLGDDFVIVTVSFNPREGPKLALAKKAHYLAGYPRQGAADNWHFLTGDEASIQRLTQAVGFRYRWDQKTQQFVHPAGITVLTPEGKISKYFFGIDYKPNDLRLALVDASSGKVGSWTDQVLLFCCTYNPAKGTYQWKIANALRIGAGLIIVALGTTIFFLFRHERRGVRVKDKE